jgi:hypothetical protein
MHANKRQQAPSAFPPRSLCYVSNAKNNICRSDIPSLLLPALGINSLIAYSALTFLFSVLFFSECCLVSLQYSSGVNHSFICSCCDNFIYFYNEI